MPTLTQTFNLIVTGIRAAIAVFAGGRVLVPRNRAHFPPTQEDYDRHKLRTAYWVTVYKRIGWLNERFQRLFTRWQAGTLPKPGKSRAGETRAARKIYPALPTRFGWLNRTVPDISQWTAQCERMLRHPDLPEFLAAAPQAMRLVRPLCRMLGLKPPEPHPKPIIVGCSSSAELHHPTPQAPASPPNTAIAAPPSPDPLFSAA